MVITKKRPVIVFIHGGNFVRGSAAEYDPDYLLDQDVVLVTLQYRLGMFGFLSAGPAVAPGCYGRLLRAAGAGGGRATDARRGSRWLCISVYVGFWVVRYLYGGGRGDADLCRGDCCCNQGRCVASRQ